MTSSQSTRTQTAPARSMTGYARARRRSADVEIVASVKSVNHRALDIHFHCAAELDAVENDMRALVRRKLTRGHVEIRVSVSYTRDQPAVLLNAAMLDAYLAAFRQAAAAHDLDPTPDLNAALRVPGMFAEGPEHCLSPELQAAVLETLAEAIEDLNGFREREAAELLAGMLRHNDAVRQCATELAEIRSRALPLLQTRLSERLRELLRGSSIDPQRLTQEVAMLADRSDVSEEISRLTIHSDQLRELLAGGGEIGKKLDFLLQEMNRETNTILSKTTGVGEIGLRITELALAVKADIEKIREQSLNLE
jgi:uncharacterized protein (TIGR00255 family)